MNLLQAINASKQLEQHRKESEATLNNFCWYIPILFPTPCQTGNGTTSYVVPMLWLSHFMVLRTFTFNEGATSNFLNAEVAHRLALNLVFVEDKDLVSVAEGAHLFSYLGSPQLLLQAPTDGVGCGNMSDQEIEQNLVCLVRRCEALTRDS